MYKNLGSCVWNSYVHKSWDYKMQLYKGNNDVEKFMPSVHTVRNGIVFLPSVQMFHFL